jgi:hypothetical protein
VQLREQQIAAVGGNGDAIVEITIGVEDVTFFWVEKS